MKTLEKITAAVLVAGFLCAPMLALSADSKGDKKDEKAKPYPLKTCVVSDEKLGGDMGDPYVFTHDGREIKLCCKSCLKDFNKDTANTSRRSKRRKKRRKNKGVAHRFFASDWGMVKNGPTRS